MSTQITGSAITVGSIDLTTPLAVADGGTGNSSRPMFRAKKTSAQNITTGASQLVVLDVEEFDTANCFSSNRFTPNVAGYYQVGGTVKLTGISTGCIAFLNTGTTNAQGSFSVQVATSSATSTVSAIIYFNGTTDYVELHGYSNTASIAASVDGTTFMYGYLVEKA